MPKPPYCQTIRDTNWAVALAGIRSQRRLALSDPRAKTSHTQCGWKGEARYYTIAVDGQTNPDAAWYYPTPKPDAANLTNHVAFWKGVQIIS